MNERKTARWIAALLLLCCAQLGHAENRLWVVVDSSAYQPIGSLADFPFQDLPAPGQKRVWSDPQYPGSPIIIVPTLFFPYVAAHDMRPTWRANLMRPISDAMAERLRPALVETLRTSLDERGLQLQSVEFAQLTGTGTIRASPTDRGGDLLMVVQRELTSFTWLGWDNRQVVLCGKFRFFKQSRSAAAPEREQEMRKLRYVSAPVTGDKPFEAWSANGATRFLDAAIKGWGLLVGAAVDPGEFPRKASRRDTTELQVMGKSRMFPGKLWKTVDGIAYVANSDGGVTLVELGGPPAAP